jgi:hypothetical protein
MGILHFSAGTGSILATCFKYLYSKLCRSEIINVFLIRNLKQNLKTIQKHDPTYACM